MKLEAAAVEVESATLRDAVAEEVLVPAVGAPTTGGVFDRFPQGPARILVDHRQDRPEGDEGEVACRRS